MRYKNIKYQDKRKAYSKLRLDIKSFSTLAIGFTGLISIGETFFKEEETSIVAATRSST